MSEHYEFSHSENEVFEQASKWIMIVGVAALVLGVAFAILAVGSKQTTFFISAGIQVVVAVFLFTTSKAFKNIVNTKGDDIPHAMEALKSLRGYFFVQAAALIIDVGVTLIAVSG